MKKKVVFFLLFFLFLGMPNFCAEAQSTKVYTEQSELYSDILSQDELEKSISEKQDELYEILSLKAIFAEIKKSILEYFLPSFKAHIGLFALVAVCAVTALVKDSFSHCAFTEYVGIFCIAGYTFSLISSLCEVLSKYLLSLEELILSLLAPLTALCCVSTGAASAASEYAFLSVFLEFVSVCCTYVIIPLVRACLVLSLISALSKNIDMSGVCSFLKSSSALVLGLLMTLLVGVLYFQHIVSAGADSMSARTVRYAAASFVPLVGNLLGESLKTVLSSMKIITSLTGVYGICTIIYLLIPPAVCLLINKLFVLLCASFAKILGSKRESDFLYEVNGCINLLNAAILIFSSVFIIIIALFINLWQGGAGI